ncbi:MAG: PAS domain S-box protein [Candidatus Aminicenantes bacterium]|nr:PAS domain S-box protein [Candidatus Aminicenantes bacterium]
MIALDMQTVLISHIITEFLGLTVIFFLWRQNRGRYRGLSWWTAGFGLQTLGTLLIVARGVIPLPVSIILGNTTIVSGIAATIEGVRRFGGRSRSSAPAGIILAALAGALFYFSAIRPDLFARTLVLSAAMGSNFIDGAVAGFRRFASNSRRVAPRVGLGFSLLALFSLARILEMIRVRPKSQNFFEAGFFEVIFLLAYQTLFIYMTYALALLVNERLLAEIGRQEEKFSKSFYALPHGISLTDAETGAIIDLNDGFIEILGYSREDALGKTTVELRVWGEDADRSRAVAELAARGIIRDMEVLFRKKSGELITGLWSAEMISIQGRPCVFSSIKDVSRRKKAQDGRLRLVQQKELLMRELKLRVKNSLTVISGLIGLNREAAVDPGVKTVLSDLRTRIRSVAAVYDQLDWAGRVDTIRLKDYIQNLVDQLFLSYGPKDGRIRISTRLEDLALEAKKSLPLGLILNELIINSFKYAYPDGTSGEIRVQLAAAGEKRRLTVADDGIGKIEGREAAGEGGGTGMNLVAMLAGQIGADIRRISGPGTVHEIDF